MHGLAFHGSGGLAAVSRWPARGGRRFHGREEARAMSRKPALSGTPSAERPLFAARLSKAEVPKVPGPS
jgi:hypothetical protein